MANAWARLLTQALPHDGRRSTTTRPLASLGPEGARLVPVPRPLPVEPDLQAEQPQPRPPPQQPPLIPPRLRPSPLSPPDRYQPRPHRAGFHLHALGRPHLVPSHWGRPLEAPHSDATHPVPGGCPHPLVPARRPTFHLFTPTIPFLLRPT